MAGRDPIAVAILADGFHLAASVFDFQKIADLIAAIERNVAPESPHAMRNLLQCVRELRELCQVGPIVEDVASVLGSDARCVRAILFDKTPQANWKVAFHQDRSIAVRKRVDVPAFGPWSVKAGVPHVQAPRRILELMLTARIHLDDCGANDGPLRVSPGSHRFGILDDAQIERLRENSVSILARAGDVLYMRPLLLHASSAARVASHRRVIHLEFSGATLPAGLEWHAPTVRDKSRARSVLAE
jgi:ectoine hydroxylase-related dioxygenase (phytanoyl-CoA dioxygenase family)